MNRHERRARRQAFMAKATAWYTEMYPALKVEARLTGFYDAIPWYEYEMQTMRERYTNRHRLRAWLTFLPVMPKSFEPYVFIHTYNQGDKVRLPTDWLTPRRYQQIKSELGKMKPYEQPL